MFGILMVLIHTSAVRPAVFGTKKLCRRPCKGSIFVNMPEDLGTKKMNGSRHKKDGVYYLDLPGKAFTYVSTSSLQWHYRLGHPSLAKLRQVVPSLSYISSLEYSLSEPQTFLSFGEGASRMQGSIGSVSSRSDDSEYDAASNTCAPPHLSISSFCLFMSKPIHPFSFPDCTIEGDEAHNSHPSSNYVGSLHSSVKTIQDNLEIQTPMLLDLGTTQREPGESTTTASRVDFAEVSEPLEPEISGVHHNKVYQCSRCELCLRFLSQRSPWGVRRMVCSGDMPIVSVLSCWHVYHADCLERTTSKPQKHDPPCPLCEKSEGTGQEQWTIRNSIGLPWSRSVGDEGTSRAWCWQEAGDCAEGAVHAPQRNNSVLLRNRSLLRRHLTLKRDSSIEQTGNSKRSGLCSSIMPPEVVGCASLSRGA